MVRITPPKLVLWDLDGTIIDSFGIYAAVLSEAAELSGLSMPDEQKLLANFHGSLDEAIKQAFDLVEGADFAQLLNDFLRIQEDYYRKPEEHIFGDALTLMQQFAQTGSQQIVVTNREHKGRGNASPRYLVSHSSLAHYISDIVCGEETPVHKPEKAVIQNVTAGQQYSPEEMMVVGDQHVDALLAKNLECQAVIVARNAQLTEHLKQLRDEQDFMHVVTSLAEVTVA